MTDSSKPAIFVFTTAYLPLIGGAEIAIKEVVERLQGEFRFVIFTARLRRDLPRFEVVANTTIIRIGAGIRFDKWLLMLLGPCMALWRFRRESGRVLFWGVDISQGAVTAALTKFLCPRIPFILTLQYGYGALRLKQGRFGLIGFGYRFMLGRASAVTAISSFLAKTAGSFGYTEHVPVIPNGAAIERFDGGPKRRIDPEHPIIITTSRLVHKNGVDTLIRAIVEVRKSIPGVRCHILGDGPERRELEALSCMLDVSEHVRFFGNIPNAEIPQYLASADIFVRPARSEGMGNAFVEALAAGLPVIGTALEGIPDIIEDGVTGLFTKVDDPSDCARQILRLIADKELRERIVERGRTMVRERFSWDVISAMYAGVFARNLAPRILVATPMFPPDIGGPGAYAKGFAEEFTRRGYLVSVLCYGRGPTRDQPFRVCRVSHRIPSGLKHFLFAVRAWRMLGESDAVLVFDPVIVGAPIALACMFRRRVMIVRVEGDFLWEWFCERTQEEHILAGFYKIFRAHHLSPKERFMYRMAQWVFSRANALVFSSEWRREIFRIGYPLKDVQSHIIPPAIPESGNGTNNRDHIFRFIGRFVRVKNIPRLVRAFLRASRSEWRLELIGAGPMQGEIERIIRDAGAEERIIIIPPLENNALSQKIRSARAILLPSITDVSPNVILDCIAAGTPFLLTEETGFRKMLGDAIPWVNPLDESDIEAKMKLLLAPQAYERFRKNLESLASRSWGSVADDWVRVLGLKA